MLSPKYIVWQLMQGWPQPRLTSCTRFLENIVESYMAVKGASSKIEEALLAWPQVTAHSHRFGGTEYKIGAREIGHIHGDWLVDIPFPTKIRNGIVAAGRAEPHHILPESGWISFYLREDSDVQKAIELFRESYEIALKQRSGRVVT